MKTAIIALVAVGSSLAVYAGINQSKDHVEKAQTECCDKTECCPISNPEECCELGCD